MESVLYKITIRGRVQGVGYRHSASAMARYLGIHGFVRNERDGSVYVEAEGTRKSLEDFVRWCRKGPGTGYVDSVSVTTAEPCHHSKFQIRY